MAKRRYQRLPITSSKAGMRLITAICCGDEDLGNWVKWAMEDGKITGTQAELKDLKKRLSEALGPPVDDRGHETRISPVAPR